MKITTDHKWRNLKYGYEMPEKFRADFDYIDAEEFAAHNFMEYRGQWYDVGEFMNINNMPDFAGWHGYSSDSYFSGVLIRLSQDGERVQVGRYCS